MAYKLSDAQLIMMSTAAQRNDRCLMPSETLKGAALSELASKFIRLGLVRGLCQSNGRSSALGAARADPSGD